MDLCCCMRCFASRIRLFKSRCKSSAVRRSALCVPKEHYISNVYNLVALHNEIAIGCMSSHIKRVTVCLGVTRNSNVTALCTWLQSGHTVTRLMCHQTSSSHFPSFAVACLATPLPIRHPRALALLAIYHVLHKHFPFSNTSKLPLSQMIHGLPLNLIFILRDLHPSPPPLPHLEHTYNLVRCHTN